MGQRTNKMMQGRADAELPFFCGLASMANIFSSRTVLFIRVRMCRSLTMICLAALLVPSEVFAQALSHTCQFNVGPRAGQQQSYPQVQPIPVGSPCQDGMGSTGVAMPDGAGGLPTPRDQGASLSHTCQFNVGPRAGQQQSYPQVQPIPVGSPCQDGVGSTGLAVPDPIQARQRQSSVFPCPSGMQCVSIPPSKLPVIRPQLTMVWCWVASAQAIFEFYGHDVDQAQIVTQVLGSPVVTIANAPIMLSMLNNTYTDRTGKLFSARTPQIWDAFSWLSANPLFMQRLGAVPLDNTGIRNALAAGRPLLIGTSHHAMVLVGLAYRQVGPRIVPQAGLVLDPAPTPLGSATGLRPLLANEMSAFFAADVVVNP